MLKELAKIGLITLAFWFVVGLCFGGYNYLQRQAIVPTPASRQDPGLLARANELGIDSTNVNLLYANKLSTSSLVEAKGVFTAPNTISILPGLDEKEEREVLAHEYMHYTWSRLSNRDQVIETNYQAFLQTPELQSLLKNYTNCDKLCIADEVNAYACTSLRPEQLAQDFNQYCDSHIKNRAILFQ